MNREPSYAEKLVEERARLRKKLSDFEGWRWQASVPGMYKSLLVTKTVTETQFLCFKRIGNGTLEDKLPTEIAREFHSFLAQKRDQIYRRIKEIEKELDEMS